jgi:hypothetical protein
MSMLRWLRVFVPVLLVALIVAGVVLVFSSRNDLRNARARVDAAWNPLQKQLDSRYDVLHAAFANDAIRTLPGPFHTIATQVALAYQHWRDLEQHQGTVAAEVAAANDLEAAGRRFVNAAQQAPRLKGNQAALALVDAYANNTLRNAQQVKDFESQVARFQKLRDRPANRLAARVLGYSSIPDYDATPAG